MALAIICSGGDAPGMNPAIKKFVDYVYEKGETPYFVYNGLEGLIDGAYNETRDYLTTVWCTYAPAG